MIRHFGAGGVDDGGDHGGQCIWPAIVVRATRDITEGEELLWDSLQSPKSKEHEQSQAPVQAAPTVFFAQRRGQLISEHSEGKTGRKREDERGSSAVGANYL